MIRVVLPHHLRTLAGVQGEVALEVEAPVTQRTILDALEAGYPMLRGTIRDHVTKQRRPLVRFFACEEDVSHDSPDAPLPDAIASGREPFLVVGAMAGGSGKGGQAPPSEPPPLSGTFGAPPAQRSASQHRTGDLGKTDSHTRQSRRLRPPGSLS